MKRGIIFLSIVCMLFVTGCVEKIELSPDNEAICDDYEGDAKIDCLDNVQANKAVVSLDASLCADISDETEKRECEVFTIINKAIALGDKEICKELLPSYSHKFPVCEGNALFGKAKMFKDSEICNEIELEDMKSSCLEYFG